MGEPGTDASGPSGAPAGVGAAAAGAAAELPRMAADAVQLVVDAVHDKAIRPVVLLARAVVFGLIVAAGAVLFVTLGSIAALRIMDVYGFGRQVWLGYVVLGGLLTLAGLVAWSRRTAHHPPAEAD
jgi:hypothetical protein